MTPVIPCSFGSINLITKPTLYPRKEFQLPKSTVSRRYSCSKSTCTLTQILSRRLLQRHGDRMHVLRLPCLRAVGADVATEEQNPSSAEELSGELPEVSPDPAADVASSRVSSTSRTSMPKRSRPTRKSEMPPVKDEDLVPGASFTGKVRAIQPFGAFVDFGAFADGLVHISKLSNEFVKDVSSVVSVGQEVKVKLVEVNMESRRISLTMLESDDTTKPRQRKNSYDRFDNEKPRGDRKKAARSNKRRYATRESNFVIGEELKGTVTAKVSAGSFISFPEGEEGFLPISEEEAEGSERLAGSSLQEGQIVKVRVLRFSKGKLTLTMKKKEVVNKRSWEFSNDVESDTNAFAVAFHKNKDIASFLETEKKRIASATLPSEELQEVSESETAEAMNSIVPEAIVATEAEKPDPSSLKLSGTAVSFSSSDAVITEEKPEIAISIVAQADALAEVPEVTVPSTNLSVPEASLTTEIKNTDHGVETLDNDKIDSVLDSLNSEAIGTSLDSTQKLTEVIEPASLVENASDKNNDSSVKTSGFPDEDAIDTSESVLEKEDSEVAASIVDSLKDSNVINEAISYTSISMDTKEQVLPSDPEVAEMPVTSQPDGRISNKEKIEPLSHAEPVKADAKSPDEKLNVNLESGQSVTASSGEESAASENNTPQASISPALVKQLREETGAGMMDCKKALTETNGNIAEAQQYLRKKGLAGAAKKASRVTAEGRVGSYIHDSRIGVLIEVNCETDFVSRGEIFRELVDDLAMQVAACPQVQYLTVEDVPEEFVQKETEIEMQKEDLLSKPEQMRSKIVDGRIRKRLQEFALLEQPFIKNDKMTVGDLVKQTIATLGENIKVKRFARYNLGEGLEKKTQDFAAEVAAQTAVKASPEVPNTPPPEAKETSDKAPTVVISAALVKQLREETGSGMMDCKKALAETGGDLEKAQEYLRKKGLSSADKKSSRLAAEGTVSSYIHDSRIGVLIEVNCETDFVAQNEKFKELVGDLAMQVVACPQVQYVSVEDVSEDLVSKEKEIEMQREDLLSKHENIREKIVEGRVSKRLGELALLEQPFIKDDSILVKDLVKQTVAALGENIRVRRFIRYTLGE